MSDSGPTHVNVYFRALVPVTGLFVVTLFAYIALLFGDPDAPQSPAQKFLDAHALTLFAGEVVAIVALAFVAMALDRRQTLRHTEAAVGVDRPLHANRPLNEGVPSAEAGEIP